MIHRQDLALRFLDSLFSLHSTQNWMEIEQHEFDILHVEAQYKNGALTEQSRDLTAAVAYFDSLAQNVPNDDAVRFLQAKAHYYLGTEERLRQQDVKAASDFIKALTLARDGSQKRDDPQNTRFIGLAYFRLGEILNAYNIQSTAVAVFDSAKACFEVVNDTLGVAASIRNIGEVYQSNKDYEKALVKFKEANALWDFGEQLYDHAIGGIFFTHHQFDSAYPYLERSFYQSGPYARIDASAKLAEICHGRDESALENQYTLFYVQNSIREANRSSDKMEIEFLCDALRSVPPVRKQNNWSNQGVAILVLCILAIIAVLAFIIVRNRHRISHIEKHLSSMEQLHREETQDKDRQIEAISQQLNDTRQQLKEQQTKPVVDFDKALSDYMHAPITTKIHKLVDGKDIMTKSVGLYPQLKLSEVEFIELVQTANRCFPDFSSRLLRDYKNLSTADVRHCCLALMGLNDAEIAVLEGITYSGANRRTNRILSLMGQDCGLAESVLLFVKNNITN